MLIYPAGTGCQTAPSSSAANQSSMHHHIGVNARIASSGGNTFRLPQLFSRLSPAFDWPDHPAAQKNRPAP